MKHSIDKIATRIRIEMLEKAIEKVSRLEGFESVGRASEGTTNPRLTIAVKRNAHRFCHRQPTAPITQRIANPPTPPKQGSMEERRGRSGDIEYSSSSVTKMSPAKMTHTAKG